MSASDFPKCFSGSRPGIHMERKHTNLHKKSRENKHLNTILFKKDARKGGEKSSDQKKWTIIKDDKQGGLQAVQTHT